MQPSRAFSGGMALIEIEFYRTAPIPTPLLLAVWRAFTVWGRIVIFFPLPYHLFRKGFYGDHIAIDRDGVSRAHQRYDETVPVVSDVREGAWRLRWMNLVDPCVPT